MGNFQSKLFKTESKNLNNQSYWITEVFNFAVASKSIIMMVVMIMFESWISGC